MREIVSRCNKIVYVVNTEFHHGNPFDPHAEGKPRDLFRVVADIPEYLRMDHAGTKDFKPAGVFTDLQPLPLANNTANVHLCGRLRERKVARSEPKGVLLPNISCMNDTQHALQVRKPDMLIHHKSFDLMKHRRVRNIAVTPVDSSRRNNLNGRKLGFHRSYLDRRGMCPQDDPLVHVKGILHISGRVVLRDIQRFKIVVIRLNIRPFGNGEPQGGEDLYDFFQGLGYGMFLTYDRDLPRHRDVDAGCQSPFCAFLRLQNGPPVLLACFQPIP